MNRIEQVATQTPMPIPAQRPEPRLPRSPADVRRRAARALLPSTGASARARRGTSGLAVAIAALAVPLMPSPALGAVASTGSTPEAPQARHHLPHGHVVPGPDGLTIQAWAASGWMLTVPLGPAEAPAQSVVEIDHPRPVVLPDGTHGEIAAYRVSRASPRTDDPDAPGTQSLDDPADPDGSASSMPSGDVPSQWHSGGPAALRTARSRVVPGPLIPFATPPNTMQMESGPRRDADIPNSTVRRPAVPAQAVTADAVAATASPCLGAAYPAGSDRYMQAHLRPATDDMDVVVTPHRTACSARVDYLSQARA